MVVRSFKAYLRSGLVRRVSFVLISALVAADAAAQTCTGTSDVVCTNSGAVGAVSYVTVGAVNLTNINTVTGTATSIDIVTDVGNAVSINDGVVNGAVRINAGNAFNVTRVTATSVNNGSIYGSMRVGTDGAGDATAANSGYVGGNILVSIVGFGAFGNARISNDGDAGGLIARNESIGDVNIINTGLARGFILAAGSASDTVSVINSGQAVSIITTSDLGYLGKGLAKTVNSGTVAGTIDTEGPQTDMGEAITDNSGIVGGDITTTVRSNFGTATTTNRESGVAGNITTTAAFNGAAVTVNLGRANNLVSIASAGAASVVNGGFAASASASSDAGSASVANSGMIAGTAAAVSNGGAASFSNSGTVSGAVAATSTGGAASVSNSGALAMGVTAQSDAGGASISNAGSIHGTVAATSNSGPASVINYGAITGTVQVTSNYNGTSGPGSFLTNGGLIDGSGQYAAIDLSNYPDSRMTLNLMAGSRVIGRILISGDVTSPGQIPTTINIQGGRGASSILTFGDSSGGYGLADTGARVNVTNAAYVMSGNSIAMVDPSSFAVTNRNMVDFVHAIGALATGRLSSPVPVSSEGQAIGFAPTGNVARDMFDEAFASLAYAGQDRVLAGNPNFTAADGTSIWAQGFGGRRIAPGDGAILRSVNNLFGGAVGVDRAVQPGLRLGAFIGGGNLQSDLDLNAGRTTSNLAFAGLYGRYALNGGFADVSLLGGGSGNSSSRRIENNLAPGGVEYALANYAGWFVSPEIAFGFDRPVGRDLILTPTARLRYLAAGFGAYQESGSTASLAVAGRVAHYFEERMGAALTRSFNDVARGVLQLSGTAGLVALQRAGDNGVNAVLLGQSLAFATPGQGNLVGYFAGAGIDWRRAAGPSLFAAAEFSGMSDSSRTITGRGGLKIAFE